MQYSIEFSVVKTQDSWSPLYGAQGVTRYVGSFKTAIPSDEKPTKQMLHDVICRKYGLDASACRYWPDMPGRFTIDRLEDVMGNASDNGHYLATYDIYIECRPTPPSVPIGHLGLPSIDGTD